MNKLLNRDTRKWLYGISLAVIPLLVLYGVINQASAPLWIALVGSILSPTLALTHLTPPASNDDACDEITVIDPVSSQPLDVEGQS